MKASKIWFLPLLFALLCACRSDLKPTNYIKYISDKKNGLKKVITINSWEYTIQYKPHDYIVYMEEKGQHEAAYMKKRLSDLKGTVWFNISFRRVDNSESPLRYGVVSLDEYNRRLDYYLNQAVINISLVYGTDVLKPNTYLFEPNYNLAPQETIVVSFLLLDNDAPKKDMQLVYDDVVFQNGIIKTTFKKTDLDHTPKINF